MRERRERDADGSTEGESRLDRYVLVYVRDSMLWPVLAVVIGHAAVILAPLMLYAVREMRTTAVALLAALVLLSVAGIVAELRKWRRPGAISALLATTWSLSLVIAVAADHYGIF